MTIRFALVERWRGKQDTEFSQRCSMATLYGGLHVTQCGGGGHSNGDVSIAESLPKTSIMSNCSGLTTVVCLAVPSSDRQQRS